MPRPFSSWPTLVALLHITSALVRADIVVTYEDTDPNITYLPFLCNNTASEGTNPAISCPGAWQIVLLPGASNGTVASTLGPGPRLSPLPQLFLVFRGTSLLLRTSALSNATANVTLTATPSNLSISTLINSSVLFVSAVDLPAADTLTLAVTYVPDGAQPARLDIDTISVTAPNSSATSLPSTTPPSSSPLPSFVFHTPSPSISHSRHLAQPVGTIVGESLAGFFGLILLFMGAIALLRHRQGRRGPASEGIELQPRREGKEKSRS